MKYTFNQKEYNTNLAGKCLQQLENGTWKLGLISDNKLLLNENSDFYKTVDNKISDGTHRTFKNKVQVKLIDNTVVSKHIIHWVPSSGYFCITEDNFWDQFSD